MLKVTSLVLVVFTTSVVWSPRVEAQLAGAIFTTLEDGTRVNANIYEAKEDVYLDGGPGPNAPSTAAGLPPGNYYFQVTDPSGKVLLSEDPVKCREFIVSEDGVIVAVVGATSLQRYRGDLIEAACEHQTGIDQDQAGLGAITVQLMPYADTPNRGGVYKVWITPVDRFVGNPDEVDNPDFFHGFVPRYSKTDNYKVRRRNRPDPDFLKVRKFHDENLNCIQDEGEAEVIGWEVTVIDPLGVENTLFTPVCIVVSNDEDVTWTVVESQPAGTAQTSSALDGVLVSCLPAADPSVDVFFEKAREAETREVLYGNVGVGTISACKFFDRNGNGAQDDGELGIPGWEFVLTGVDAAGNAVGPVVGVAGIDGCTTFGDLLPGDYTVTESTPIEPNWQPTTPTSVDVTLGSTLDGATIAGESLTVGFGNVCTKTADFDTKGYWHNKNGLAEITPEDVAFVNGLDPYDAPSSYFGDGDEPFDGEFTDGTPVAASLGNSGELIAPDGTALAEISQFLVDSNGGADPREQLAQQLLAFIFNTIHRLDGAAAAIQLPDGSFVVAGDLVAEAIEIWANGSDAARNEMAQLLDAFNNNDAVPFIPGEPCEFSFDHVAPLLPIADVPFVRGDANSDRTVDISDAIFTLDWLFLNGATPSCELAADSNDSESIDLSDVVSTLSFIFTGGTRIAAPFPECGSVEPSSLSCERGGCPQSE